MLQFIGRLHPLWVHLPIGMLLVAAVFFLLMQKERFAYLQKPLLLVLILSFLSALVTVVTGYILSLQDAYDAVLVGRHQNLGLLTCLVLLGWIYIQFKQPSGFWNYIGASLTIVAVVITGHYGGSLTHGAGYLKIEESKTAVTSIAPEVFAKPLQAHLYKDVVVPILEAKCYSCHSSAKQKGHLRLDAPEFILKGGEEGPIVFAGDPGKSSLMQRLELPKDHEKHMPPLAKAPLTEAEIKILHFWISNGLSFTEPVQAISHREEFATLLNSMQQTATTTLFPADAGNPASTASLQALKDRGVVVTPISRNQHYLIADFVTVENFHAADLQLLLPLQKQLVGLKLRGRLLSNEAMEIIGKLTELVQLDISGAGITDNALQALMRMSKLQDLHLVNNKITHSGLLSLGRLKQLRQLYLYLNPIDSVQLRLVAAKLNKVKIEAGNYTIVTLPSDTSLLKAPLVK